MTESSDAAHARLSDAYSRTSLGPIDTWPARLRRAFDVCLQSTVPSFVWWGPELVQLYNKAGAPLLRGRVVSSFGVSARDSWADAWPIIGPVVEQVLLFGDAGVARGVPLEPGAAPSATHVDFYCNAIRGDHGPVAGLYAIAVESMHCGNQASLYQKMLDAAVRLTEADFASLQLLDAKGQELRLVAHRGFPADAAAFWDRVGVESNTSCGKALARKQRVVVPDVEDAPFIRGTIDLRVYRDAGIRAMQTTPLVASDHRLVGMISTHWRRSYRLGAGELERFDVLAREVADVLGRDV